VHNGEIKNPDIKGVFPMKKANMSVALALLLTIVVAAPLIAARDSAERSTNSEAMQGSMRVSEMLDTTVKEQGGGDVGQIEDVVFDAQGRASYAILAGPYNKFYPIPIQALSRSGEDEDFILSMDKDRLDNAPSFAKDEDNWPNLFDSRYEQQVFGYYGEQSPSGASIHPDRQEGAAGQSMGRQETMTQPRGQQQQ
jgi:sporulation protein YlmC with PRC-barrel domain